MCILFSFNQLQDFTLNTQSFIPTNFFFKADYIYLANEFQQMVRKFNFSVIQRHYLHCKQPNRFTHKKGVRHFQIACHFYMVLQIDGSSYVEIFS